LQVEAEADCQIVQLKAWFYTMKIGRNLTGVPHNDHDANPVCHDTSGTASRTNLVFNRKVEQFCGLISAIWLAFMYAVQQSAMISLLTRLN
jgi:hypothetical protein